MNKTIVETDQTVDLTPTPVMLRVLGEIPFDIWQCLAELSDNSIDAFRRVDGDLSGCRIDVSWSSQNVPLLEREIVIEDNGSGMSLESLQRAAKAGYSSNDPIHQLGLFGMGFNIATARLGDETLFLSCRAEDDCWRGLRINFEELIKSGSFHGPVITTPKSRPDEHGTRIIITKSKDGIYNELRAKERSIRERLGVIYSQILETSRLQIFLQGKQVTARRPCVWASTRYVMWGSRKVEAVQEIDRDLGAAYFDVSKNRYLSDDESAELDLLTSRGETLPANIVARPRRLRGWVGIQRYAHPSDFGIDFIRNGRKILIGDKRLFEFENPSTGKKETEYPVELGSTVGGRIVGEVHVDYLIPTYQKNDFSTNDRAWKLTLEALRGSGPLLPRKRAAFGFDGQNTSPVGLLVNAYRRADAGTKHLAAPNSLARDFAAKFASHDKEFQNDDNWFKAAQEADREKAGAAVVSTTVAHGALPSDDVDSYVDTGAPEVAESVSADSSACVSTIPASGGTATTTRDSLLSGSDRDITLSGDYSYSTENGFQVTVRRLKSGDIRIDGKRVPCQLFADGVELDFVYDPSHPLLSEYNITPKQLLLQHLAERFAIRDHGVSMQSAFYGLVENHLGDERINQNILQDRSRALWRTIAESLPSLLGHRAEEAFSTIEENLHDKEELVAKLLELPSDDLYQQYASRTNRAYQALPYCPRRAVLKLIHRFPEEFLDGKLFKFPYADLPFSDQSAKERLRSQNVEKLLSYLRDALLLMEGEVNARTELIRLSSTLMILESRLV